jgi:hypothetical protein
MPGPGGDSVPQQVGLLLAVTRPNEALVTIVEGLHPDVQAAFWRRVTTMFVDPAARSLVARALLERRRPWGAIDLLATMLHTVGGAVEPDVDLVESALMSAATGPSDDSPRASSLSWEVGELLDYLERSGSDTEIRARLEFLYAHLLEYTRPAREAAQEDCVNVEEVAGQQPCSCARKNVHQEVSCPRRTGRRAVRWTRRTVAALRWWPSRDSSPCKRRYPQDGFSCASRSTRSRTSLLVAGRPGWLWVGPLALDEAAVPGQQRAWRDQAVAAQPGGQQPGQRGQDCLWGAITRPLALAWDCSAGHTRRGPTAGGVH